MLDEGDMRMLTQDQQREIKEYEYLFGSSAWVRIARDAREKAMLLRLTAINAPSAEALAQLKGRVEVLDYYAELDKSILAQYQSYVDDAQQAGEEDAESKASNS